ncbi:MAG: aminotransferase class I/II-fold pyridoxal phosphate-dependent enzyme, partial [Clostridia bacterium]|nr:aminotransferase class I/II-fold pyridoxal phosphate-dependent enzyme [Clostridia bacterium]
EAYDTNWLSTIGENINEVERQMAERIGCGYAVGLGTGTAALHLAVKLAGVQRGDRVFCSDMTFSATVNPVSYEGAQQIFVDAEYETWNLDPDALEKAFRLYPDVKCCIVADLYGTPAKLDRIREICHAHGAVLIEDAAEALGSTYKGKCCGAFGDINCISFNGNKVITGSAGGMLLTDSREDADRVRKWSTQSRDAAPWYQHSEMGYNYRMSNIIAGAIRGQIPYLDEHIAQKSAVFERYREGLKDLPVSMNPFDETEMNPNHWLSCLLIRKENMCEQVRTDSRAEFIPEHGKSCPTEILNAIASINAEGRPIWKPMHCQPVFSGLPFVSLDPDSPADEDIFARGLCLPSDNKMTEEEQDVIIEVIRRCFD